MELKQDICPHCGGTETVIGKQTAANEFVVPKYAATNFFGTALYHVICRNCGTLIRSYVDNPEALT